MKEELLSLDEINEILQESTKGKYSDPHVIGFGNRKTSIFMLSRKSGLILINGNSSTGYKHIYERHSALSRNPYWKQNKLDNPSKFRLKLAPIEYLTVMAGIYKPENICIKKNKRPNIFDVFIGIYKHHDGLEVKYRLITYKNTGIIHSFFVDENKKPFNKKKIIDLRQGWVSETFIPITGVHTYEMSYYNSNEIEVYKIIMKCSDFDQVKKVFVQKNSNSGKPFITSFLYDEIDNNPVHMPIKMIQLNFSDVSRIERIIKQMQNGTYSY